MTMRVVSYLLVAVVALVIGWKTRGWQEDSTSLAVERAAQKIADDAVARESTIAEKVEEKLAGLTANQTVIDRGIIREIQKPIYQRVCLEPDAVRLLNDAARGKAPSDTRKPAGGVP
ncbi:hypothetical protein G3A39_41835 [Paraburkholderia aspalathi]|nr:hypothetical protein [Paraburkholderia aspalathi]